MTENFGYRKFQGNPMMLARWVDEASLELFRKIDERMTRVSDAFDMVSDGWRGLCDSGFTNRAQRRQWKKNLRTLAKAAGELRDSVDEVPPRITRIQDGLELVSGSSGGEARYSKEMSQLESWVNSSEAQIQRYFFNADHSVRVSDLRGPDMSAYLELVHDLAEALSREP